MCLDRLPPEILGAVLAHVPSTADLARLAAVSARVGAVARDVRAARAQRRGRRGPHADPIGCAHQVLNAIASDNVIAMIDALDVGAVNINDALDVDYLQAVAAPNVCVVIEGTLHSDRRTVIQRARESIGCAHWSALEVAVVHGSAACVRALVSLGARVDRRSLDRLIDFVLTRTAWRRVSAYMVHALSPVIHARSNWPRVVRARMIDPVAVLGPLVDAHHSGSNRLLHRMCMSTRPFHHLAAAREALVDRVWPGFGHIAAVDGYHDLDDSVDINDNMYVDDARRLVALLLRHGCRPDEGAMPDAQGMAERWRSVVLDTRHPPSPEQVAAWRATTASTSERSRALLCLERARTAACDKATPGGTHRAAIVRDVLSAIVDAYDIYTDGDDGGHGASKNV
ncbi:hypothetical protein pqer_cds_314 [Pandoravirus quercus]|uniref:F-box incomplete domain containing protein n=2 Tax=Pandoravirus TaxID=2060084 RepID=A0A2U7U8I0_9VIRU|nr:hypothetical protein pqer_cds_314 [Pandoravirus quercus]AVK74736.1 hypothetical protein pqer_cds_314 [Pandoravirus quercus]QBZ80913.1 hypothetical protein pclt_cds_315 [Pandoravirus celtis]